MFTVRIVALALLCLGTAGAAAQEKYVWMESEKPSRTNVPGKVGAWGRKELLSEESWLHVSLTPQEAAKLPKDGALVEYDFTLERSGRYEVWNRIGFEFARTPFAWRVDGGAWQTITPDVLTSDLMEIDFWCEVAWVRMGRAELGPGKHTLQIRPMLGFREEKKRGPDGKETPEKVPEKLLYVSDCVCLYPGEFRPHGKLRPDEPWQTEEDKRAAAHVFELGKAPPAGERMELPLGGLWEVCRYDEQEVVDRDGPTRTLPPAGQGFWSAMRVPGNKFEVKPELRFCHRFVYRTRVRVPAELAGRSCVLRFPSINMIASLHVNGQFCGWTKAMLALWECDVTRAIRPGQVNEICLIVKDAYYAFSPKKSGKSCRLSFNAPVAWMAEKNWLWQHFDFPVGSGFAGLAGILEEPSLRVAGEVYTKDVFAVPSVKRKQLGLEISLVNSTSRDEKVQVVNEVVPASGGRSEKTFPAQEISIPAGAEQLVNLTAAWPDARLWWPEQPHLYRVVTKVLRGGEPIDVHRTTFGFREWEWDGPQFTLNGAPRQLWADTTQGDGGKDPEAALGFWQANSQNMWRFWGLEFGGLSKQKALDLMDRHGVVVRRSGIFDGQGANYLHGLVNNQELFDNWIEQMRAWIREERNHPSILVWSLENEVTFINARNLGISKEVEPQIARGAREVMRVDPTRPVMVDGGNCLADGSLPVNGVHYMESFWRDYPDEAYTLAKAGRAHEQAVLPTWGKCPWPLDPFRPIFMGESFYLRGSKPGDFAQFGGEGCFGGWSSDTRRGAGLLAKMLAEGYRWHGVAAQHFWLNAEDAGGLHHNSWRPVCLLCRQWNWTFAGGGEVSRTLKLFNNWHRGDTIEAAWQLVLGDRQVATGKRSFSLGPGQHQEFEVSLRLPRVSQRTRGEFLLTCRRGGQEVFREVKPVAVIDPDAGPKPALGPNDLIVFDPAGTRKGQKQPGIAARLAARGVPFGEVASMAQIPAGAKVVVVGKDALSAREATDPRWLALAGGGTRLLVLEQAQPLRYTAVPADLTPTDYVGRVAFAEDLAHPVFAGLDQPDFFTWSKDHVVYRNVYLKATQGAVSLAHCDEQLGCSAICECPVNDGLMVLCQMAVGEKLSFDPVAQRLFDNMLAYCAGYAPVRRRTAVVMDEASPAARLLAESGLKYDRTADVLSAVSGAKHDVVVFEAGPASLKRLAGAPEAIRAFTGRGGWLMPWGVTPEGLADFNRIVGVEHVLRPFERERVTLAAVRDPLLAGLTGRDVAMESAEQIFPWAGDKYMVDDEFTWLVDLDDVAPFCEFPGAKAGDLAAARTGAANWPRNVVNGFTSADAWKLIHYLPTKSPRMTLTLPRQEEVVELSIVLNTHYAVATRVDLYFDDDRVPVSLKTSPTGGRQDFPLEPRKARKLVIELAQLDKQADVTGIDNLWIRAKRPEGWGSRVKPLLNVGGLVKYPMGQGGVVLNQLRIKPGEPVPVNAQKKRAIVGALLRNLHATYAGSRVFTTGNLRFRPLPLHEQCNQYLTRDRGWLEGGRDLAHLPVGRQQLAGVTYVLRDFRTSPVPSCVMLAGPGAKGPLPGEVKGLKIGGKADALFFLHTLSRVGDWRPPPEGDRTPPAVFRYLLHYADGGTAEVPVRYGEGVDHWIAAEPAGLKNAAVAWAAPWPGDASGQQAVVYQMQWNNPRPEVEIVSMDLGYDPAVGSQYGVPVLLAVTAGTQTGN